jgi:hypothetical protein
VKLEAKWKFLHSGHAVVLQENCFNNSCIFSEDLLPHVIQNPTLNGASVTSNSKVYTSIHHVVIIDCNKCKKYEVEVASDG